MQWVIQHILSNLKMLYVTTAARRPLDLKASGVGQVPQGVRSCAEGGGGDRCQKEGKQDKHVLGLKAICCGKDGIEAPRSVCCGNGYGSRGMYVLIRTAVVHVS